MTILVEIDNAADLTEAIDGVTQVVMYHTEQGFDIDFQLRQLLHRLKRLKDQLAERPTIAIAQH